MGRKRRRSEPSGRQIIQAQQMFQNLLVGLDTAGVQRLLEGREVLAALADGRLPPKKSLASLGLPVVLDGARVKMDFFGLRKESEDVEVLEAFRRQGLRPASDDEYQAFRAQHPETVHDIVVRSRLTLILMGERVRMASHRARDVYWGYRVYYRTGDGDIVRDAECVDSRWDKTYRFLGVRLDRRPREAAIPSVSIRHVSPKVRPQA